MIRPAFPLLLFAVTLGASTALPGDVRAGEAHDRLSVEATVASYCDIGGSASRGLDRGLLDFGRHRLVDTVSGLGNRDLSQPVKGVLLVRCSDRSITPEVSFDYGLHATGKQRNLQSSGGSLIPYVLLRGSSPSQGFWDDNAYPVPIGGNIPAEIPVYGYIPRLPASVNDGVYTDTVSVRLDF